MADLIHHSFPLDGVNVLMRGFYFKSSIYWGGQHAACDLVPQLAPVWGAKIHASGDGIGYGSPYNDYQSGYNCYVQHPDGSRTGYRHLNAVPLLPATGALVLRGQVLGYVGSTGNSTGPHLHYDMWYPVKMDPEAVIGPNGWWRHDPWARLTAPVPKEIDMKGVLIEDTGPVSKGAYHLIDRQSGARTPIRSLAQLYMYKDMDIIDGQFVIPGTNPPAFSPLKLTHAQVLLLPVSVLLWEA